MEDDDEDDDDEDGDGEEEEEEKEDDEEEEDSSTAWSPRTWAFFTPLVPQPAHTGPHPIQAGD